jgi:CubicO group peptidase (beta-lactamase class C family)
VTPDHLDRIGALLDEAVGQGGIPGAVAVIGRGPVTLGWWVVGQADATAGRPMHADTIFDLASLTKVVATTTVTLALAGQGELKLSDPVAGYLPDAPACRDGQVTIAHLLMHTSGLPGSRKFYRWCGSRAELLRDLHQTPLNDPPGSWVAYSDLGFMLLGEVVTAVAGEPLDAAVCRLVTGPLGLTATGFRPNGPAARFAATECRGDGTAWTGTVHDENARLLGGVAGHAGLFAPAADLARFAAWWVSADDAVVPAALRRAATTCQTAGRGGHRGYGWACVGDAFDILGGRWPPTAVSHTGFTGTSLALDPASGAWVVLLTNAVHAGRDATAVKALRRAVHEAVRVLQAPYLPDLDLAEPGHRVCGGHPDGLLQAGALEHVVPADDLLGLGERPVADQDLAVAHQHCLGFLSGPEPVAVQPDAAGDHVLEPGKAPGVVVVGVGGVRCLVVGELGRVDAHQHHELHVVSILVPPGCTSPFS